MKRLFEKVLKAALKSLLAVIAALTIMWHLAIGTVGVAIIFALALVAVLVGSFEWLFKTAMKGLVSSLRLVGERMLGI